MTTRTARLVHALHGSSTPRLTRRRAGAPKTSGQCTPSGNALATQPLSGAFREREPTGKTQKLRWAGSAWGALSAAFGLASAADFALGHPAGCHRRDLSDPRTRALLARVPKGIAQPGLAALGPAAPPVRRPTGAALQAGGQAHRARLHWLWSAFPVTTRRNGAEL